MHRQLKDKNMMYKCIKQKGRKINLNEVKLTLAFDLNHSD